MQEEEKHESPVESLGGIVENAETTLQSREGRKIAAGIVRRTESVGHKNSVVTTKRETISVAEVPDSACKATGSEGYVSNRARQDLGLGS
jgi:hypothetical protein